MLRSNSVELFTVKSVLSETVPRVEKKSRSVIGTFSMIRAEHIVDTSFSPSVEMKRSLL